MVAENKHETQKLTAHPPTEGPSAGGQVPTQSELYPGARGAGAPPTASGDESSSPTSVEKTQRPPGLIRQYELVDLVKAYDPQADEDLLNRAYVFAMRAHGDQKRKSGDPYFSHPLAVAGILTDLKLDPTTIATALLHDVAEDTDVTISDIRDVFGGEVARLVDGVTKISKRELAPDADGKAESFVKFIMATAKDIRVLLVKLADRLHNMRTLHFHNKPEKRERIALETMEIFAPLAGRIGVGQIKEELEDLSFQHLNPSAFEAIDQGLSRLQDYDKVHDVVALAQTIRTQLEKRGIVAEVLSREKRAFSIWRKMQRKGITFEELADIYGFRVIVDNDADCYRALGVIHTAFPMIPGEFDDYISTPKPNGYQSIHTAVLATHDEASGQRVEIQIRSRAMHDIAERGVAAHWRYKDAAAHSDENTVEIGVRSRDGFYAWVQSVMDLLDQDDGASEFLDQARFELYQDQVFPFSPRGRVIPLPSGATALDFAYALHTDLGDQFAGAKINGVQRPNRTRLKNGDVVEVLRSEHAEIPDGAENYVVTGPAKSGLRRRRRRLKIESQRVLGERFVKAAFSARDVSYTEKAIEDALKRLGYDSVEDVFAAVGRMEISGQIVVEMCFPALDHQQLDIERRLLVRPDALLPRGILSLEDSPTVVSSKLALCCLPVPGERIVGLREDGSDQIDVHRIDCNALGASQDAEWLNLKWFRPEIARYAVPIVVTASNRTGAFGHIGTMLARYDADIVDLHLKNSESEFTDLHIDVAVGGVRHLNNILTALRASDYVVSAVRCEGCSMSKDCHGSV